MLERLRTADRAPRSARDAPASSPLPEAIDQLEKSGTAFVCEDARAEAAYRAGIDILLRSFMVSPSGRVMLIEGDDYRGCWLESTGSACAETLARFCPGLAESTFLSFAESARADGLLPYKLTADGPAYRQVQMVTPFARSAWEHYRLNAPDPSFLRRLYAAAAANDAWLARHRDTRGSGCVEAFCAYDTGMDLSPRFWHLPDTCRLGDPASYDPEYPVLPFLSPDLTANVYCQRRYLSLMADALGRGDDALSWGKKADASLASLMRECFDPDDGFFYDKDAQGRWVRIQTDVLLRVLCCEAGDDGFFDDSLRRYLLNPRKFFAKAPLTSCAMDDPRFDANPDRNSWAGPVNFLSLLRAPRAFERHGRRVELQSVMDAVLRALPEFRKYGQCLDPWTAREGFGSSYVPAVLCVMDYVERSYGILPLAEGGLRFSSAGSAASAYSRRSGGSLFELDNGPDLARVYKDGMELFAFPRGLCARTDGAGRLRSLAGISPRKMRGAVMIEGRSFRVEIDGNAAAAFDGYEFSPASGGGYILPGQAYP